MKRSEALEKARNFFIDELEFTLYSDHWPKKLLEFIENDLRMQPATIIVLDKEYNRQEGTYGFEVNEWEPEND